MKEGVFSNWLNKEREKEKEKMADLTDAYKKGRQNIFTPPKGKVTRQQLRRPMKQD